MKLYDYNPQEFEDAHKNDPTRDYMIAWNYAHNMRFSFAQGYAQNIRNQQHAASSLAIKEILS